MGVSIFREGGVIYMWLGQPVTPKSIKFSVRAVHTYARTRAAHSPTSERSIYEYVSLSVSFFFSVRRPNNLETLPWDPSSNNHIGGLLGRPLANDSRPWRSGGP